MSVWVGSRQLLLYYSATWVSPEGKCEWKLSPCRAVKSRPIITSHGGKGILEVKIYSSDSNGQEEAGKSKTGNQWLSSVREVCHGALRKIMDDVHLLLLC